MLPALRPAVLLVDDDKSLIAVVARRLLREGFRVRTAESGPKALAELESDWPAIIVVDLMMPRMDGFELCRRIKRIADLPIIVLSALDSSESKVFALEEYAEDYITKPFDPDELVARIQRVLRRIPGERPTFRLGGGEVEIDLATRRLRTPEGEHPITRTESRLLHVLVAAVDRIVPTDAILDKVWAESEGADPSYVWVTVRRLRRKLERDPDNPRFLLTERGVGYRLSSTGAG